MLTSAFYLMGPFSLDDFYLGLDRKHKLFDGHSRRSQLLGSIALIGAVLPAAVFSLE